MGVTAKQKADYLRRMRELMKDVDVNKDGYVSLKEYTFMGKKLKECGGIAKTTRDEFLQVADDIGLKHGMKMPVEEAAQKACEALLSMTPVEQTACLKASRVVEKEIESGSTSVTGPKRDLLIAGPEWFGQCKKIKVLDSYMSYFDSEEDSEKSSKEVLIFLHGNAASSYLWRHIIIPHFVTQVRCLAPDLIGMGESGKSGNNSYRFVDHYKYLTAWFELMDLPEKVVFVVHDWGSGLAFHWCRLNSDRVKALVHMESVVDTISSWEDWPNIEEDIARIKSDVGEYMVLKNNFFVETMLPTNIMRKLDPEEMAAYLKPYKEEGESRRPTLTWPREIPLVNGGVKDVVKMVQDYNKFLKSTVDLPKLFIAADPGFFTKAIQPGALEWPNTTVVTVKGLHFLQEDSDDAIAKAIKSFLQKLNKVS